MAHACHAAVVEVDAETGAVEILRYVAVHDAGTMVNPRSLEGQIIGGTVQGIGTALLEELRYDDGGRLVTDGFLDYLIPSALEAPEIVVGHRETPSPLTVHGIKGGGEAGRLMAPAAVSAAIEDALGVACDELPATPERILSWIARSQSSARST
jgi:CO/xanthine dehydrogenase Mo-binding subunit